MRRRVVKKFHDQRVAFEHLLHDGALHAAAPSVNQTDFAEAGGLCLDEVLFDDRGDVWWRERMQIEHSFDGDPERVLILHRLQGVLRPGAFCRTGP